MIDLDKFELEGMKWPGFKPTATEEELNELELFYGHPLPEIYKEIMRKYNIFKSKYSCFNVYDEEFHLNYFYSLGDNKDNCLNIWWAIKFLQQYTGPDTLPFATDESNETYFFKWVNDHTEIWLLRTDELETPEDCPVTDSLDELLNRLYMPD